MNGIVKDQVHTLKIGYRGNDDGATTRDGFEIAKADTYILNFEISDGVNKAETRKAYNNLP